MIIQKNAEKQYVLCVVYEPNVRDAHDDWMTAGEIEKSCHEFTKSLQKQVVVVDMALKIIAKLYTALQTGGDIEVDVTDLLSAVDLPEYKRQLEAGNAIGLGIQHAVWDRTFGDVVENYIMPVDVIINEQIIRKGTWLIGIITNNRVWQCVKDGTFGGVSMGGVGCTR